MGWFLAVAARLLRFRCATAFLVRPGDVALNQHVATVWTFDSMTTRMARTSIRRLALGLVFSFEYMSPVSDGRVTCGLRSRSSL